MSWEPLVVAFEPRHIVPLTTALSMLDEFAKAVEKVCHAQRVGTDLEELSIGTMKAIQDTLTPRVAALVAKGTFKKAGFTFDLASMPPSNFEKGVAESRLTIVLDPAEIFHYRLEYNVRTQLVELFAMT